MLRPGQIHPDRRHLQTNQPMRSSWVVQGEYCFFCLYYNKVHADDWLSSSKDDCCSRLGFFWTDNCLPELNVCKNWFCPFFAHVLNLGSGGALYSCQDAIGTSDELFPTPGTFPPLRQSGWTIVIVLLLFLPLNTWYGAQLVSKVKPGIICLETTHLDPQKAM